MLCHVLVKKLLHRPFHGQKIRLGSANVPAPQLVLDWSLKNWSWASNAAKLRCHRPVREHGTAKSKMRRKPATPPSALCIVSGFRPRSPAHQATTHAPENSSGRTEVIKVCPAAA